MKPNSLVSVIIPVYNGECYVAEAIRSVLAQDYQPIEIIIVDDGSIDSSAVIAKSFGRALRYCWIRHGGPAAARNKGVRVAGGDFLSFLDADDIWEEHKLVTQMQLFSHNETIDMCFTYVQQFFSLGSNQPTRPAETHCRPQIGYHCSTMVVKKDAFYRVGFFHEGWRIGEFIDWYARAKSLGLAETVTRKVLVNRRIHDHNFTRALKQDTSDYARILKKVIDRRRGGCT